jgi:hypothetical protein
MFKFFYFKNKHNSRSSSRNKSYSFSNRSYSPPPLNKSYSPPPLNKSYSFSNRSYEDKNISVKPCCELKLYNMLNNYQDVVLLNKHILDIPQHLLEIYIHINN